MKSITPPYDKWFENRIHPSEEGLSIFFSDITDRKKSEQELNKSRELFKTLTCNSPDHIIVQDKELRYMMVVNPQLGLTDEDMIGKTDFDLKKAQAEWARIQPGMPFTLYGHHRRKDGSRFPVEVHFGTFDLKGERYYMGLVLTCMEGDISERRD